MILPTLNAVRESHALAESGRAKLSEIRNYLNELFVERSDVIQGLLIAMVGRFNVFIGGPVGTGKSNLAEKGTSCVDDGYIFDLQLFKGTDPAELLGPWNPQKIKEGAFERASEGYLQSASVAFIDELDKGGSGIMNAMLRPMNERKIRQGKTSIDLPLRTLIGAANANLTDANLAAFMDRFHLKFWVGYIKDVNNFKTMITTGLGQAVAPTTPPKITIAELDALEELARVTPVDPETLEILGQLRLKAVQSERQVSDRRWFQMVRAAQVAVALDGGDKVMPHHLRIATPFLVNRENDTQALQLVDAIVPRQPVNQHTAADYRQRLADALTLKNPTRRGEVLRALSQEISAIVRQKPTAEVMELKVQVIHALNETTTAVKKGI